MPRQTVEQGKEAGAPREKVTDQQDNAVALMDDSAKHVIVGALLGAGTAGITACFFIAVCSSVTDSLPMGMNHTADGLYVLLAIATVISGAGIGALLGSDLIGEVGTAVSKGFSSAFGLFSGSRNTTSSINNNIPTPETDMSAIPGVH